MVRELSDYVVVIRSPLDEVLHAVKRDFGTLFTYWRLGEGEIPANEPEGVTYVVADRELLPISSGGKNTRVPTDTKLQALVLGVPGNSSGGITEGEKRVQGRSAMPVAFL